MNIASALAIALGLCMDNFAVTLASGCAHRCILPTRRVLLVAACFMLAHMIMFGTGWLGGWELGQWMNRWDHWVAFALLVFVGIKMIGESLQNKPAPDFSQVLSWRMLVFLSLATSLDALGVGVALSLENAPFWMTFIFMAVCVFLTSCAGFELGRRLGQRFGKVMEILGGLVLIGLGTKILLSGLGIW